MKSYFKNIVSILALLLMLTPYFVLAVCSGNKICNPIGYNTINDFIKALLEGVIKIGMPIIALAIIYSGFLFVFAQGNETKLKTAKLALLYSLVGAAVLLSSWAIAQLISDTVIKLN